MKKGLSVVTTNKGPLAVAMPALLELAKYEGVQLRFSGTVGGGTPMLDFAKQCLKGDKLESLEGILNGTTNYVLTKMHDTGIPMEQALNEAKKAGFAEADPTYDMSGLDTATKLVIISNWVMGKRVSVRDVDIEGILKLSVSDIQDAKRHGKAIKLVAHSNEGEMWVRPKLVSQDSPLCVKGTLNAMVFTTETAGEITLVGPGAGGNETAAAVLRDLIEIKTALLKRGTS